VVVVNSLYVKSKIADVAKLMKREPVVIYHGIQTESDFFTNGQTKNIAIVGRLSREKGVDIALNVIQKVLLEHTDAKLWVIGDGKEMSNLQKQSKDLGISNSVCFFSHVNNVQDLLAQCSMLIMTSRWEGFGLVLLEAMKLKMPCLAFNHVAANEIIDDNESGFLIPYMDIDLMSQKIIFLLNNKQEALSMGEKGNQILIEKFSIKHVIDQHESLLLKYKS
jgi:glycosyltransferase involved in cell wall biosynthesis